MRILLSFLFFTLSLSSIAQWEAYQNLNFNQKNPSSETPFVNWQKGKHVEVKSMKGRQGASLMISGEYAQNQPGYAYQQHEIELQEFSRLRVSAEINTLQVIEGKGSIYAYFKKGEQWLAYQEAIGEEKSDWEQIELEIIAPPNADLFRIGVSLEGKGKLLVDNFKIEEIEFGNCDHSEKTLAFMQEVVDTIKLHSLFKEQVDKEQILSDWQMLSACKEGMKEVYDALNYVIKTVDKHSFYWSKSQVDDWENTSTQGDYKIELSQGYHIDENYAYLTIPNMGSGDSVTQVYYATQMQHLIDSLDGENVKGWIIDLRQNGGGNCWPMLAGIGPLLGEPAAGYFVEEGHFSAWNYKDGASYEGGNLRTKIEDKAYQLHNNKPTIAVLFGGWTGSSGEIMATSFTNHPNATTFGQKTAGYSTGNENFTLSDGSMLFLAASVYADRDKNLYPDGIDPDVLVEENQEGKDLTLAAALEWLKKQ